MIKLTDKELKQKVEGNAEDILDCALELMRLSWNTDLVFVRTRLVEDAVSMVIGAKENMTSKIVEILLSRVSGK